MNHIIPGTALLLFFEYYFGIGLKQLNSYCFIIVSYILGIIIDRVGSFLFEHVVYKIYKGGGSDYKKYINACRKDDKIEVLATTKNLYRNLSASFLIILLSIIIKIITTHFQLNKTLMLFLITMTLTILMIYSTIRIGKFIDKRIDAVNKNK